MGQNPSKSDDDRTMDVLLETVLHFPSSRALLSREYMNGSYRVRAYFLSLALGNLILCGVNVLVLALPVYLLVGLQSDWIKFGTFVACLLLMAAIGGAHMLCTVRQVWHDNWAPGLVVFTSYEYQGIALRVIASLRIFQERSE